jgi:hypothetical protein
MVSRDGTMSRNDEPTRGYRWSVQMSDSPQTVRRSIASLRYPLTRANAVPQLNVIESQRANPAQMTKRLLEHTFNPQVLGSSPSGGTKPVV